MKGFDAFNIYASLKLHFNDNAYNAIKYNFKTSVKLSSFIRRNDRYFFEKWESHINNREILISFFVSNFLEGRTYIIDFNKEAHMGRIARMESLTYNLGKEIKIVAESGIDFNHAISSFHPNSFMSNCMRREVSLETMVILNHLMNYTSALRKLPDELCVYEEWITRIEKYQYFLKIPKEKKKKLKKIILDSWSSVSC